MEFLINHWLDITTTLLGLAYILLEYKASIWMWAVGAVMQILGIVLYYQKGVYADCGMEFYYLAMTAYGYWKWKTLSNKEGVKEELPITHIPMPLALLWTAIFLVLWFAIWWLLTSFTDSTVPIADSFTTALSLVGIWALAHKYLEQWFVWIAVDVVTCVLYFHKDIPFKASLYGLYVVIAVFGYLRWRRMMKQTSIPKSAVLSILLCLCCTYAQAQDFGKWFQDKTLRLDYTFSGDNRNQYISLDEMKQSNGWFGRRTNLDSLLLLGGGQLCMKDSETGQVIYRHSFSTLFQEWQTTEEATHVQKSFENVFLVPFPKRPVEITVTLTDTHNKVKGEIMHRVDPQDILIRPLSSDKSTKWEYLEKSGDSREKIDVVFVAEGYLKREKKVFMRDCRECIEALKAHEPFKSMSDRFNFVAVMLPSQEQGVSIPHKNIWKETLLSSSFDTFYSNRYLTTLRLKKLHDVLAGIPYEHIIILANTDNYGGGGIYNSYLMSAAHNNQNKPVVVHEFGHSFAGLADEYYYDDQYETMYPADTEPWEPNLTTLVDFKSKWADMLDKGVQVPTIPSGNNVYTEVGVYEGGGYQSKGVYRPSQECRMKVNQAPVFCPVCERAIRRMIDYQTK